MSVSPLTGVVTDILTDNSGIKFEHEPQAWRAFVEELTFLGIDRPSFMNSKSSSQAAKEASTSDSCAVNSRASIPHSILNYALALFGWTVGPKRNS